MRILTALGLATVSALALSTAAAQTATGTLNLTGNVPTKCAVSGADSTTVDLGDLSGSDGRLKTTLASSDASNPAASFTFNVTCTGAAPRAAVDADPLVSSPTAATGFTNTVNLTGSGTFTLVAGGPEVRTNLSSAAAGTATALPARLANAPGNVTIKAYALTTAPGDVLVAGSYTGKVVVTIAPGA